MSDSQPSTDPGIFPQRLDRSAVEMVPLTEAGDDVAYWHRRTSAERLEYMEQLRHLNYGDAARGRLQRVFEIVQRPGIEDLVVGGYAVGHGGAPQWFEYLP